MVFIMQIYVDHVFISDRRRAVIGPTCRYSDQLPISIRYGHADWVSDGPILLLFHKIYFRAVSVEKKST